MNFQCKVIATLIVLLCAAVCVSASEIINAIEKSDLKKVQMLLKQDAGLLNKKSENGMTPLCFASYVGKGDIVSFLIETGADLSIGDNENSQPIHNAAVGGHLDVVKQLLKAGACPEAQDDNGVIALHFALNYKHPEVAEYLIDKTKNLEIRNSNGWTALLYAVIAVDVNAVKKLLAKGAEVNAAANNGIIPLHSAASFGNLEIVKLLLDHGANIHQKNDHGETPLFWALNPNCLEVARLLIQEGADVKQKSIHGQLALHNVCHRGTTILAQLHLEHGADVNALDSNGWSPLTNAAFSAGSTDIIKFLLSKGAQINVTAPEGVENFLTPLHGAIRGNNLDAFKLLVENGADIDEPDSKGNTPLIMAIARSNEGIVEYLLSQGCALDKTEGFLGRTALHASAIKGLTLVTEMLIQKGADIDKKDKNNKTAMDYAVYYGFKELAQLLAENGADKRALKGLKEIEMLVSKPLKENEAILWYLEHSAWAIRTANHLLVFDYAPREGTPIPQEASLASGYICPEELKKQNVCVFASHGHGDHYSNTIFDWKKEVPNIRHVLGFQPQGIANNMYTFIGPRSEKTVDGMKITTIKANDQGVGFLVEVDGLNIFHSGDHANRNADLSGDFTPEIDFIADLGRDVDLAFFPISGCGFGDPDNVRTGVHYAMEKIKPHMLFPTHAGNSTFKYQEFADITADKKLPSQIGCAVNKGDRFFYSKEKGKPISMK
ncbi:MAG: ankyrin repeat domain-containing protein [Planctomycetota bacterium]